MERFRGTPRGSRGKVRERGGGLRSGPFLLALLVALIPMGAFRSGSVPLGSSTLAAQVSRTGEVVVLGAVFDRTQNVPVSQAWVQLAWIA
jgi:hypothetical protein